MEAGMGSEARPVAGAGELWSIAYILGRDSAENKTNRRECRDLIATC